MQPASGRPLKARAEENGLLFGTAADRGALSGDPDYADRVVAECAMVTPENSMKWERIRPEPDRFDFGNADWLVDFAEARGLLVHGHTLVWDKQMPAWFDQVDDGKTAERVMIGHIETVAGRYAGRLRSWDVVNEAINPDDGRGDGLRATHWLRLLGPDYVDLAFRVASEVDPGAIRVWNDFGIEFDDDWSAPRREALLDQLTALVARGTPIDALGIQSHLSADPGHDFGPFDRFLSEVADLGLDVMITELDMRDAHLPADEAVRDGMVAETYKNYLDVVLAWPNVRSVAVWGLSDRHSWLSEFEPRDDGLPVRPLPLDRQLARKPAWSAISCALSNRKLRGDQ